LVNANLIGFVANDRHPGRRDLRVHGMRGLGEVPVAALTRGAPPPEPEEAPAESPAMLGAATGPAASAAAPADPRTFAQEAEVVPVAAVPPPVPEEGVPYSPYPRPENAPEPPVAPAEPARAQRAVVDPAPEPDPRSRYEQPTQLQPVVHDEPAPRPRFGPGDVVPPVGAVLGRRPEGNGTDDTGPAPGRAAAPPSQPPQPPPPPPPPPRVEAPAPPPPAADGPSPAEPDAEPEAEVAAEETGMPAPPPPGQTLMGLVLSFGESDRRPPG
jgi:hypothetical protein